MSTDKIHIVLVNFNGRQLLEKNLPLLAKAIETSNSSNIETTIVDNNSNDGSCEFIENHYPWVRLIKNSKNEYFSKANNTAVWKGPDCEYTIFLNTDMEVDPIFIDPLINTLKKDPSFFAAVPKIINKHKNFTNEAITFAKYYRGFINPVWKGLENNNNDSKNEQYIYYACGGATATRTKYFKILNGFDPIFTPLYYEDVDLSYRAWKMGWKVIYQPQSQVFHDHAQTTKKVFTPEQCRYFLRKNEIIMHLKNFSDFDFKIKIYFWILFYILRGFLKLDMSFLKALLGALRAYPALIKNCNGFTLTDKEVLNRISCPEDS